MNKNALYAFYGTLREGRENYFLYGKNQMKLLDTVTLKGFELYSLGDYPYAVRTNNPEHTIIADLFNITDISVDEAIYSMELEAGYYYDEVEVAGKVYGIYLFKEPRAGDVEIESGDWVNYIMGN